MKVKVFVFAMGLAALGVMGAKPALAQVTPQQAIESANNARQIAAFYDGSRLIVTFDFRNDISAETLEIYRAAMKLQNMNAQQKLSCAAHILSFFGQAAQVTQIVNDANQFHTDAAIAWVNGFLALVSGDASVADEYFIDAKTMIEDATEKLGMATGLHNNMVQSIAALKSIVDQVPAP